MAHHDVHRASSGHRWRDADDFRVLASQFQQGFAKDILELWRLLGTRFRYALAAFYVELAWSVPDGGGLLRHDQPLTLDGVEVEELRPAHVLDAAQNIDKSYDIVAVGGAEIAYVHALEHVLLVREQRFQGVAEANDGPTARIVQDSPSPEALCRTETPTIVGSARLKSQKVVLHAAHAAVDAHIVVV